MFDWTGGFEKEDLCCLRAVLQVIEVSAALGGEASGGESGMHVFDDFHRAGDGVTVEGCFVWCGLRIGDGMIYGLSRCCARPPWNSRLSVSRPSFGHGLTPVCDRVLGSKSF